MGNTNICMTKEKIDEANLNLEDQLIKETSFQEQLDYNQQKSRYQMLYDIRKPINSIPSNNISMEIYDDKIYFPQPQEGKQQSNGKNANKINNNDDYIIDLDIEIYDGIDDITYVNTKDKISHNQNKENNLAISLKPINKHYIGENQIKYEITNEMNKTSATNYNAYDKQQLPSSLDRTQRSAIKESDIQYNRFLFSISDISKDTIALYHINIKESNALRQGKSIQIETYFPKQVFTNSNCNKRLNIIFQSEIDKVTPKTLKLVNNYCFVTKDCFYIYKSKEAFLFQLNSQYVIKFNPETKISIITLLKNPHSKQKNLGYKYFLLYTVQYSFVFAFSNYNLFMKWLALLQHLIYLSTISPK